MRKGLNGEIADSAFDARGYRLPGTKADGSEAGLWVNQKNNHGRKPSSSSGGTRAKSKSGTRKRNARIRKTSATAKRRTNTKAKPGRTAEPKVKAANSSKTKTTVKAKAKTTGSGKNSFILEVPFDERYTALKLGARYDRTLKTNVYDGDSLPDGLAKWRSKPYSYARWIEDQKNAHVAIVKPSEPLFTPRTHQAEAAKTILNSYDSGSPGFLIADSTGLGKTLSIIAGMCMIARKRKSTPSSRLKVLISCPNGAIPIWRQTLRAYKDSMLLRPLIISYNQLHKLLKSPAKYRQEMTKARKAKTKAGRRNAKSRANRALAREGVPKINFDLIVYDESHYLKNYGSSAVSMAAASMAKLHSPYRKGRSPYVIYSTATPGSVPLNLAIMAPTLGPAIDPKYDKHVDPSDWGGFLHHERFHIDRKDSKHPWSWITTPWYDLKSKDPVKARKAKAEQREVQRLQDEDTKRIGQAWTKSGSYLARNPSDVRGWPEQQVEPFYIELDESGVQKYEAAWTEFRKFLKLKKKGQTDPKDALTARLRFRQKASLLKAPMVAEHAAELVESGDQVFIGCQFLETVDIIAKALTKYRVPWTEVTGRLSAEDKVAHRIDFQKGKAKVIICTVTESISCHAGETLPDGSKATDNDRVTIISDIRENPNDCIQQMGRCHREGKSSLCEFPVILDTVDVRVMGSFIDKSRNLKNMRNDDDPDYLDKVFEDIV